MLIKVTYFVGHLLNHSFHWYMRLQLGWLSASPASGATAVAIVQKPVALRRFPLPPVATSTPAISGCMQWRVDFQASGAIAFFLDRATATGPSSARSAPVNARRPFIGRQPWPVAENVAPKTYLSWWKQKAENNTTRCTASWYDAMWQKQRVVLKHGRNKACRGWMDQKVRIYPPQGTKPEPFHEQAWSLWSFSLFPFWGIIYRGKRSKVLYGWWKLKETMMHHIQAMWRHGLVDATYTSP